MSGVRIIFNIINWAIIGMVIGVISVPFIAENGVTNAEIFYFILPISLGMFAGSLTWLFGRSQE